MRIIFAIAVLASGLVGAFAREISPAAAESMGFNESGVSMPSVAVTPPGGSGPVAIGAPVGVPHEATPINPDPGDTRVHGIISIGDVAGLLSPYIDAILNALIPILIGWIALRVSKWTGVQVDQKHQDTIATALQNEAHSLLADGAVHMQGKVLHVNNEALADAVNNFFVVAGDAAKFFNVSPQYVAARVIDNVAKTDTGSKMLTAANVPIATPGAGAGGTTVNASTETGAVNVTETKPS